MICVFFFPAFITPIVSKTGPEPSEHAREAPDCVLMKSLIQQTWYEKWCGAGAKQEVFEHGTGFWGGPNHCRSGGY